MNNSLFNKILLIIIGFLLVVIISGSLAGLLPEGKGKKSTVVITNVAPTPKEIKSLNKISTEKLAAYTGIGKIRAVTKSKTNEMGCPLVITPWFTYPEENIELYEELSKKRILITGIFSNYFSNHTKEELLSEPEEKIKADLLNEINSQLVLGKIIQLYFTDYIFLE